MWIAAALLGALLALWAYLDTRKPANFPPGPRWLPVLGSALGVAFERSRCRYLFLAAHRLARRHGAGRGVLGLRAGKDRIVVPGDLAAVREMLLNEDLDGRPQGPFYETRTWGQRRGLVLTDGDSWKEQRRFIVRHLKEFGFGRRGMAELIRAEAEQLLADMAASVEWNNSAIVRMHDAFNVYVLNTLWSMMAGIRYSREDAEMKHLQQLLFELFSSVDMVGALFSHFPVLRYLSPELSGYNQFLLIHKKVWQFLRTELDKHQKRFKVENEDRDYMDVYLRMLQDPERKKSFTESQLLAVCMDMFMAGSETTSKSLGFAFLYLVREQEVQKKAQHEIDVVIGKERLPTLDDRANMPYNEALVLEAIRHFMGRCFGIPHRALRDTKLCGYSIPKDAMVVPNFYGILMNDEIFEKAQEFRPERFLVDGKVSIPDTYIPFGLGKHRCMGEALARSNIFMFTVTMLQNFDFKIPPGEDPPTVDPIDGATPSATPFHALVVPRHGNCKDLINNNKS